MRRLLVSTVLIASALSGARAAQTTGGGAATVYEGARLIIGDTTPPIDNGAFVVQNGTFMSVGRRGEVKAPAGAARVDLAGKTVMPTLNNAHIHIGYEGFTSWSAKNHGVANVLDHLRREAFYGTSAVMTMGDQPDDFALKFQQDQAAGTYPAAARFLFAAGMAPPGGGPDVLLIQGTTPLKAVYEVSTAAEARRAVQQIAAKKIGQIKIWVDDRDARRGSMQKMPPEVIAAVIEEAHKRGIIVHAHATTLPNQKAVVKAGADVLVHTVGNERIDDEFMAMLKEKRPYWASVMGLTDTPEVCEPNNTFVEQSLPDAAIADIKAGRNAFKLPGCGSGNADATARREDIWKFNVTSMVKSGARLVLATDAGVLPGYSFGWSEHHEMAMYVRLGLSPAEVIVASTSRPTEVMKIRDSGTITAGKVANFIVLQKDPLADIRNTRTIESVFLAGNRLDREGMISGLKAGIPDAGDRR